MDYTKTKTECARKCIVSKVSQSSSPLEELKRLEFHTVRNLEHSLIKSEAFSQIEWWKRELSRNITFMHKSSEALGKLPQIKWAGRTLDHLLCFIEQNFSSGYGPT